MSYPGGHTAFLLVALATHALVGYTLGTLLDAPRAGLAGGLAPDLDFLFPAAWSRPLVHRGLTHSVAALACATAVAVCAYRLRDARSDPARATAGRRVGAALGVGYASHLLIDATTPTGVPLAYPLASARVSARLGGHSPAATAVLWSGCLAVLWHREGPPPGSVYRVTLEKVLDD